MRYHVRNAAGEELVVPSLRDLHHLYVHGFVADDDLVRSDGATRWVRAGALPALHGVRETRRDPRKMALLLAAAIALTAAFALVLGR
jgi:hypothetical protein